MFDLNKLTSTASSDNLNFPLKNQQLFSNNCCSVKLRKTMKNAHHNFSIKVTFLNVFYKTQRYLVISNQLTMKISKLSQMIN